jgi:CO/xanthine dehydrogenase FAD-binding subunit
LLARETELSMPGSADEAVKAFGDGRGVTIFAGGTILMPEAAHGRYPRAGRTLMLTRAGLDEISGDGPVRIGAMTPLSALAASGIEPLARAAGDVADYEVRAQATLGGNLCAPPASAAPRGDLQAALLAVDAKVIGVGPSGERIESVEEFLSRAADEPRLVLAVEFERPRRAAYLSQRRPHTHSYAVMAVACAQNGGGIRVAATGVAPHAVRLGAVEETLANGGAPADAAQRAGDGLEPPDDALASSWYRKQVLPTLVRRALEQLQGG